MIGFVSALGFCCCDCFEENAIGAVPCVLIGRGGIEENIGDASSFGEVCGMFIFCVMDDIDELVAGGVIGDGGVDGFC